MSEWGAKAGHEQLWNYIKCSNICVIVIPGAEREKRQEIFGKIMAENFLKLLLRSPAPVQKLMCNFSGLTIDYCKGFIQQASQGKAALPTSDLMNSQCTVVSKGLAVRTHSGPCDWPCSYAHLHL